MAASAFPAVSLTVILPAYNEEANIGAVLEEWVPVFRAPGIPFRLLALDDGSTDGTLSRLKEAAARFPEVEALTKPNSGHGRTCRFGYEMALERGSEWVFQIDSDGQCDPRYFSDLWNARDSADVLFGVRESRDDGMARTLISLFCRWGVWLWTGVDTKDPNVPYRLMRASVLAPALKRIPPDFDLQNVALSLVLKREQVNRCRYFPIHFRDRAHGVSLYTLRKVALTGLRMLRDLKAISRS